MAEIIIKRETALDLLKPIEVNGRNTSLMEMLGLEWVMSKEYGTSQDPYPNEEEENEGPKWAGINADDYETIRDDAEYQNFAIWIAG